MVWDTNYPDGSTTLANTLHTVLQNVKLLLRERAQANNGVFDEHSFFDSSADGTHDLSRVGFVKVWTVLADITGEIGTIHYLNSGDTDEGFYVITSSGVATKVTTPYHANLEGLADDDHTQLLLENGSRAMQTTLYCASGNLTINSYITGDSSPLAKTHNDSSWYDAHGANCIVNRHISYVNLAKLHYDSPLTGAFSNYFTQGDSGSDYSISFALGSYTPDSDGYKHAGFPKMALSVDPNNGGYLTFAGAPAGGITPNTTMYGMLFTSKAGSSAVEQGALINDTTELNE